jgi:hypothetical protein
MKKVAKNGRKAKSIPLRFCHFCPILKNEKVAKNGRKVKRMGKGIFVSRESSIFVRVKCEMLDSSVVKCDLFYSREA